MFACLYIDLKKVKTDAFLVVGAAIFTLSAKQLANSFNDPRV
jgi:hypothetical protein